MKEKLEILMADTGLRVGEIAAKLGVKAPVISHILSGRNQPNFTLTAKSSRPSISTTPTGGLAPLTKSWQSTHLPLRLKMKIWRY